MILDRPEHTTLGQFSKETEAGNCKPVSTGPAHEDNPPAYSLATHTTSSGSSPNRVESLSTSRQELLPLSAPINGLQMCTRRGPIRGSWLLDPLAPLVPEDLVQMFVGGRERMKRRWSFRCSNKTIPPTAILRTRHGSIDATLHVVGESALRNVATIRLETRAGNIFLDVASIAPMRTAHIDIRSRRGCVTLLIPRNFSGLVQLSSRHGKMEMLPALAASSRVINGNKKDTTILVGNSPMPAVGSDVVIDTARIYSRHGRVRLGFSGEDFVVEPSGLMDQAMRFVQKLVMPSSRTILV